MLTSTSKLTVPCAAEATLIKDQVIILPTKLPGPVILLTVETSRLASKVSLIETLVAAIFPVLPYAIV